MQLPDACAIIFDIDGVLVHLSEAEEDVFFAALEQVHGITGASRDWNSYKIRNDVEIIEELIAAKFNRPAKPDEVRLVMERYHALMDIAIRSGGVKVSAIDGVTEVLHALGWQDGVTLGVATANLKSVAHMRLRAGELKDWFKIGGYAESRGPKADILGQVMKKLRDGSGNVLAPERVVFLGDNPNDVAAGQQNGCHFIGFATEQPRRQLLREAGAQVVIGSHTETLDAITAAFAL